MKLNNIAITGSASFIGKCLLEKLSGKYTIISLNRSNGGDIRNPESFSDISADLVIHLAAITRSQKHEEMFDTNVNGTLNVLEFCKKTGARLIFASSASVYGDTHKSPIKEDSKLNPVSFYGLTKTFAEALCEFYHKEFNLDVTILRVFNLYGPGQKKGVLIPDLLEKIEKGEEISIKNPFAVRDFVYVEDVADAIVKSMNLEGLNKINIGTGKKRTVEYAARILTGENIKLEDREGGKSISYANIIRAKKLLEWEPKTSLEDGLKETMMYTHKK